MIIFPEKQKSHKFLVFPLQIILTLTSCLAPISCSPKNHPGNPILTREAPRVVVRPVVQKSVPFQLEYVGNIKALENAEIKARVTGYVLSYHFREGEDVQEGQLLFHIDPRPFEAALNKAKALLVKNQAELEYARQQVTRYANLANEEFISQDDFNRLRTTVAAKEAAVKADQAAMALAQIDLDYCSILAPFDGRTGQRLIDPGNLVTGDGGPGDPTLVIINQMDPIKVLFAVPEKDFPLIREAKDPSVDVIVPGHLKRVFPGKLWLIDNRINTKTGMIEMEGMMKNPERKLWPGLFVKVRIKTTTLPNALLIPNAAISRDQLGPFVFTITPQSTVEMQRIETKFVVGQETVIVDGLKSGQNVVIEGKNGLQSGVQVKQVNR